MQQSVIHEWTFCKDQCDKSRSDSVRHDWVFAKNLYPFYHSAEVHTHKRRLPMSYYVVGLSVLVLLPVLWFAGKWFYDTASGKKASVYSLPTKASPTSPVDGFRFSQSGVPQTLTVVEYLKLHTPLIPALPSTAPAYQELARPTIVPRVAGCIASKGKCVCYTQQATRIFMSDAACRMLSLSPSFRDFQGTELAGSETLPSNGFNGGSPSPQEGSPSEFQDNQAPPIARPLLTGIKPHPVVIPEPYR